MAARPERISRRWLSALVFGVIALVWGYNWVVLKQAMRVAGPFEFLAWRFGIASACLFGALAALGRPLRLTHAPQVLLIGLLQTTATFALVTWALVAGAAGKSAVLNYTMPFWVVLFAWPVLGERPPRAQRAALALAFAGLALLVHPGAGAGLPELLALASGVAWALGVVVTKRLQTRERIDTLSLSAWQTLLGGAGLVALAFAFPSRPMSWSPQLVFAVLYNGVLVGAVCWFLWFWALQKLDAGLASLGILSVPVLGVLFGVVLLGERPSAMEWCGIGAIVAALGVVALGALRRPLGPRRI
ncbi:MAG TPA: DMT family transporter [Burkholderiales bacterium]|nr:DMT family transporter [Burkholderiales bacterium]